MKTFVKVIGVIGLTSYCIVSAVSITALACAVASNYDDTIQLRKRIDVLENEVATARFN